MKTLKIISLIIVVMITFGCDNEDDAPTLEPNIDLKADTIVFSVEPTSQFAGNVTITGTIENIGDDFSSGEGQQNIRLYERQLGAPEPGDLVASASFQSLGAGETLEVTYTRYWNSSSSAEGEFPPDYILLIDYDPDLLIDGNINNDDSNTSNDEVVVNGSLINSMF